MLNPEIISGKLFLITITISVIILTSLYFFRITNPPFVVHFCNNEDKINIVVQTKQLDILINPVGEKQVLFCLGKIIPFYDKDIEYVFTQNDSLVQALAKRYRIRHVESKKILKMANLELTIDSRVTVRNNSSTFQINQQNTTSSIIQFMHTSRIKKIIKLNKGSIKKYKL